MTKISTPQGPASPTMREVRSALRANVEARPVNDAVAPIWNELLPRLETLLADSPRDLAPRPPGVDGITPDKRAQLIRQLPSRLAELSRSSPENASLLRATEIVREHVALSRELASRTPRNA